MVNTVTIPAEFHSPGYGPSQIQSRHVKWCPIKACWKGLFEEKTHTNKDYFNLIWILIHLFSL